MAEDAKRTGPGTDDTTEYSPSKAPETRRHAEERETISDARLIPGGSQGAPVEPGMSGLDRATVPNEAARPRLQDHGVVDMTSRDGGA